MEFTLQWNRPIIEAQNGHVSNLLGRIPAWSKILLLYILKGLARGCADYSILDKRQIVPNLRRVPGKYWRCVSRTSSRAPKCRFFVTMGELFCKDQDDRGFESRR